MQNRVFNFNPGPSTLPLEVLKTVQEELLDYQGTGMSVLEISHRSFQFEEINHSANNLMKELLGLGDNYHLLFVGGGASTQFANIPLNFLGGWMTANYVDTGTWASKAIKEAKKIGKVNVIASSKDRDYTYIPELTPHEITDNAAYVHITSNNTIKGTQYQTIPDTGSTPLFADLSSDICSRNTDYSRFSLFYAGAQKNLGPSGVTIVGIRKDMLEKCNENLPTMVDYKTHARKNSLFNTPPVFAIYILKLVLEWVKNNGGLSGIEEINQKKKDLIYNLLDSHSDFYKPTTEKNSRSWMNITFRLPTEDLEKKFLEEGVANRLIGLKGHRSVGGIRVSLYNAMTLEGAEAVAELMEIFKNKHG